MQKKTRPATVISPVIDLKKVGFAQSDFLTNMSYELRTPLNAILGLITGNRFFTVKKYPKNKR